MSLVRKLSWTEFKTEFVKREFSPQYDLIESSYLIYAKDDYRLFTCEIYKEDTAADPSDQKDFEDNYKALWDKKIDSSVLIREEVKGKETGGHYKAKQCEIIIGSGDSVKSIDISFPFPIALLSASFKQKAIFDSDEIKFCVAPDKITGAITSDIAVDDTVLSVQQTVVDNAHIGYNLKIGSEDFGYVLAVDKSNLKVTMQNPATAIHVAPAYVLQTAELLERGSLDTDGLISLGESKIGSSYIDAGIILRATYYNNAATAKKFRFILEYLY